MVVGMVGIEGIVVGIVGSEVGSGGRVTLGTVGKDDGIWVLGRGGNVGFGKVGTAGIVGKGVVGSGGNAGFGKVGTVGIVGKGVEGSGGNVVGMVGNGGSVTLGRGGMVCRSWRPARVVWMLESDNAKNRERTIL